jgi:DNA/RNA-binding domain of Phe-tRNA-synthetase-like protein
MQIESSWHNAFPNAHIGVLHVLGVNNAPTDMLEPHKRDLEQRLRERHSHKTRAELLELPILAAYKHHFKRFDKTYHVQLQLESVVHKNKTLPQVNPLVDAYFMAELETHVLVAGHDFSLLRSPRIAVSAGGEALAQAGGKIQSLKAADMVMFDADHVACSVLYGQEERSLITPQTQNALFVAYAPSGVAQEAVQTLLETIVGYVQLFSPTAQIVQLEVLP